MYGSDTTHLTPGGRPQDCTRQEKWYGNTGPNGLVVPLTCNSVNTKKSAGSNRAQVANPTFFD